jgi:hypothetical protein
MDFAKVLADLREELAHIDAAIASLERIHQGERRRNRTPVSGPVRAIEPAPRASAAVRRPHRSQTGS